MPEFLLNAETEQTILISAQPRRLQNNQPITSPVDINPRWKVVREVLILDARTKLERIPAEGFSSGFLGCVQDGGRGAATEVGGDLDVLGWDEGFPAWVGGEAAFVAGAEVDVAGVEADFLPDCCAEFAGEEGEEGEC